MRANPEIPATETCRYGKEALALARDVILNGRLVAVPTETVYGLAANAYD